MKKKFLSLVLVLLCMLTAVGCSIRKIEPLPTMDDYKDSAAKYSLEVTDKSVTGIACAQGRNDSLYTEFYVFDEQETAISMYTKISGEIDGYFISDDKQKTETSKGGKQECRIKDSKNAATVIRKDNVIIYVYVVDAEHIGDEDAFIKDLGL